MPARFAQPAASGPPGSHTASPITNAIGSPTAAASPAVVGLAVADTRRPTAPTTTATQIVSIASIHA